MAVAAATDVLPTPPFPVKRITRTELSLAACRRAAPSPAAEFPPRPIPRTLVDEARDDEDGAEDQQRHHRRGDDPQPREVRQEVRHPVQWDRRVPALEDDPAAAPWRRARREGHLHGADERLVAADGGARSSLGT